MFKKVLSSLSRRTKSAIAEVKSFFKDFVFGSKEKRKSYLEQSNVYSFFKELNTPVGASMIGQYVGFIFFFMFLFALALGLSLIRTKSPEDLEAEIKRGELIKEDLSITSYYELKDVLRNECTKKYNSYCKADKLNLTNFETDYRILTFAVKNKDIWTLKKLNLVVEGPKFYYKTPENTYVLISDASLLHKNK